MAIEKIQQVQAQIIAQPGQSLTNQGKVYAALDDFCKFSGLNGAGKYFIDPNSQEGKQETQKADQSNQQQMQQHQEEQLKQFQLQAQLAQAATTTAEAQQANVAVKAQLEMAKHQRELDKHEFEGKIAGLLAQIEQAKLVEKGHKEIGELQFKYDQLSMQTAIKLTEIEAKEKSDENANFKANEELMDEDQYEQ